MYVYIYYTYITLNEYEQRKKKEIIVYEIEMFEGVRLTW